MSHDFISPTDDQGGICARTSMRSSASRVLAAALLILLVPIFAPAHAQIMTNQFVSPCINTFVPNASGNNTCLIGGGRIGVSSIVVGVPDPLGALGPGALSVSGSALIVTAVAYIGDNSDGTVTVSGGLLQGGAIAAGNVSGSGSLNVVNSGTVNATGLSLGNLAGLTGTVGINGQGSSLNDTGNFANVGSEGIGSVTVTNGGLFSTTVLDIGSNSSAVGLVWIRDPGSTLIDSGFLNVGDAAVGVAALQQPGGELAVNNGGTATAAGLAVGNQTGSVGGVFIDGQGSSLTITGDNVFVGVQGTGTLAITNGAHFVTAGLGIGASTGAVGTVGVDGAGSLLTDSGFLTVGDAAAGIQGGQNGGTLGVTNGAVVTASTLTAGAQASSTAAITIDGQGSTLTTTGEFRIGDAGSGFVQIQNAGQVNSGGVNIGNQITGYGSITVSGAGSSLTGTNYLAVGYGGSGSLTVQNGGQAGAAYVDVGSQANSSGYITVTDASSSLTTAGELRVGDAGTGTLSIQSGGQATSGGVNIGNQASGVGTVTVDGAGSGLIGTNYLVVGYGGTGTLTVQNGGRATSAYVDIGSQANSAGTATVTGSSSTLTSTGELRVGDAGNGTLNVASGGGVSASGITVGNQAGSTGAISIDGHGSTLTNVGNYANIGVQGTGSVSVTNGAVFSTSSLTLGNSSSGGAGTLSIQSGGTVLVGLASSPLGPGGGLAIGGGGSLVLSFQPGAASTDIVTTGSLQLGGLIQVETSATTFTANSFIPLMQGSSINLDTLGGKVAFGAPLINPLTGAAVMDPTTGDYEFDLTNQQGTAVAEMLVPQEQDMLVPEVEQTSNANGTVTDLLGLYVDPGMTGACGATVEAQIGEPMLSDPSANPGGTRGTKITSSFTPAGGLATAENTCGFSAFDWQQLITEWPSASPLIGRNGSSLSAPPAFLDPPNGGYDYNPCTLQVGDPGISGLAYPFYYAVGGDPTVCGTTAYEEVNGTTLYFSDQPKDSEISAGQLMEFQTTLVGALVGGVPDLLTDDGDWFTWESNYNGNGGGVVAGSEADADPEGTGGITILSVAGMPVADVPEPGALYLMLLSLFTLCATKSARRRKPRYWDGVWERSEPYTRRLA